MSVSSHATRRRQGLGILGVWMSLWLLARVLGDAFEVLGGPRDAADNSVWMGLGLLAGIAASFLQRHPRRVLGIIPIATLGLTIILGIVSLGVEPAATLTIVALFMVGLLIVPVLRAYIAVSSRHWSTAVMLIIAWFAIAPLAAWAVRTYVWVEDEAWVRSVILPILFGLTALGFVLSFWLLFREVLEQLIEVLIWPIYRIKGYGPGLHDIPRRGPVIVIANHSAWFDPMWLAKVLPRRLIPMMTSVFYDLPIIRWLMVHVAHAIRVQASGFRRDVPELKEAIAALDRGECLVVFPEGSMRKNEERPLRQFGRGVWHILKERPETPVVACWIEGGWGSYFSYWNGPPTKNKKFDLWRHIDVGVSMPEKIDPALLTEHRALRTHLMKKSAEARRHLGKEPVPIEARIDDDV